MNKGIATEKPELHPVPVKSPWYHLGIDFVGPISPVSISGNHYILTVSDYFTKFGWAVPMQTKEARPVVSELRKVQVHSEYIFYLLVMIYNCYIQLFCIMGLPSVITTDQGTEFCNLVNDALMRTYGIQHRLTTAYHPQANGLDERYNQTLVNAIAKFAQQSRVDWDEKLPEVVYAYNTAVHESTKHTPFEVMFGRMARLPVDIDFARHCEPTEKLDEYVKRKEPQENEKKKKKRHRRDSAKKYKTSPKQTERIL